MDTTSKKKSNKINKKINLDTTLETALQELNTYSNKDILTEEEEVKKNNYLKIKEKYNRQELESENFPKFLFPNLDDPNFNVELIEKKQFNILKKPVIKNYDNLEKMSEEACNQKIFELLPHQIFVKNFLSFQTPYNSLLLYHGLGTGKTCSAISICEEMRDYLKQMDIENKIIVVASPNVQENFKLQLRNFGKLKKIKNIWTLNACAGNKYLKEINPMNMKGLEKQEIIRLINNLIKNSYVFMGYEQFSNYIEKTIDKYITPNMSLREKKIVRKKVLKNKFSNRLIVVDEVHNLRSEDSSEKKIADNLFDVAKYSDNLKLLLLSATPLYNSPREVTWLINLMNVNDGRSTILDKEIFDKNDNLIISDEGVKTGEITLKQKLNGYVSYLRGESPLSFPFKFYPTEILEFNTLKEYIFPRKQINGVEIIEELNPKITDLAVVSLKRYQSFIYSNIVRKVVSKLPKKSVNLGFQVLNEPLQALNVVYPISDEEKIYSKSDDELLKFNFRQALGFYGLTNTMNFDTQKKAKYEYKDEILESHGRIFNIENIGKYSSKLEFFLQRLMNTKKGIILIFSEFIDAGCIPIALALEELGFSRFKNANLFKTMPTKQIDALTLKSTDVKHKARYIMITGDKALSPNINEEIEAATNKNINGERVKVIIVSRTGTEGIDFKNIRQVHLLEPWYNNNRANQVIGRAVRNCSHKDLPLEERNVEVYKYGTMLEETEQEAADMYLYRNAESKSIKIGNVTRIMKETAIDCLLNKDVITTSKTIEQVLSSGKVISYGLKDKPYSEICDYKENCEYTCDPFKSTLNINEDSYNEDFIIMNIQIVISKIKNLFKEFYVMKKEDIIKNLNTRNNYPYQQIDKALSMLVDDESNFIFDRLNRRGNLVNIGEYYMYQPIELTNTHISTYERNRPLQIKPELLSINITSNLEEKVTNKMNESKMDYNNLHVILAKVILNIKNTRSKHIIDYGERNFDWYKIAGNAFGRINKYKNKDTNVNLQVTRSEFDNYVVEHMLDTLFYTDKLSLIEFLLNSDREKLNKELESIEIVKKDSTINEEIKKVIKKLVKLIKTENLTNVVSILELVKAVISKRIILNKYLLIGNPKNQLEYYIFENKKLELAKTTDKRIIKKYIDKNSDFKDKQIFYTSLNNIIGIMNYFKENNIVFKRKDKSKPKKTGNRCDQNSKQSIEAFFDENLDLSGVKVKTLENGKEIKIVDKAIELCVDQELIMRHYNKKEKDNKKWFLSLENTILADELKIYKIN